MDDQMFIVEPRYMTILEQESYFESLVEALEDGDVFE